MHTAIKNYNNQKLSKVSLEKLKKMWNALPLDPFHPPLCM